MGRRLRRAGVVVVTGLIVLFAAAQVVRPGRTNPPSDPGSAIHAQMQSNAPLIAVLDRSCGDCHSNNTVWSRYTQVAPLSWIVSYSVSTGRKAMNFSEWASYSPQRQRELLTSSCNDASHGKMPGGIYTTIRSEARLSQQDIETICAAARAHVTTAATAARTP